MNIVTKSSLLLIATLITGLISVQSHANVFGGSGPYVMMAYGEIRHIIWMLNTETGRLESVWNKWTLIHQNVGHGAKNS